MKTYLYTLIAICAFALALPVNAQKVDKTIITRTVDAEGFSAISLSAVGDIYFTQSNTYSVEIEGQAYYVNKLSVGVSNGRLNINIESNGERHNNNNIKDVTIRVSAPTLEKVEIEGVGKFVCEESLETKSFNASIEGVGSVKLADLKCDKAHLVLEGVGSMDVNLDCKGKLIVANEGVGKVKISGYAGSASISNEGIGSVNRKNLKVGR